MIRDFLVGMAWLNVLLHFVALALAAVGMRPGSPLVPLAERLDYLAGAPLAWTLGWSVWILCALALVVFLAAVASRLDEPAHFAQLGVIVAITGAAFDLFCDAVYILVFPMLASGQLPTTLFLTIERITGIASLVIANGAYSVGILLITLGLRKQQKLVRYTIEVGYAVAGCGLVLAAAGFTGVPWHAALATPPTIGLFCLWVLLVAFSLRSAERQP